MEHITLTPTDSLFEAVEDVSFIVANKLGLEQDEVLAKALAIYIGLEKPFKEGEVNSILQQHLFKPF